MVLDGKSSQEFPVSAGVPQGSIIGLYTFPNHLPDGVISGIGTYTDDTTLHSGYDQAFDLWQKLELASEFESDLHGTVNWVGK